MAKILSIKQLTDDIKKVFIAAKRITVIINASYIKESKAHTYYTSPIGYIIDKRLYTVEQLSKHAFAESLVSVKKGWYTVIKCNSHRVIWAISVDCASTKTYKGYDYYPTSLSFISQSKIINRLMEVKEFDLDVDVVDDAKGTCASRYGADDIDDIDDAIDDDVA